MKKLLPYPALMLLAALLSMPAVAENKKPNPEREQIRRLQQAQQKTEQEKASLQQEKAAVEEQLKASGEKIEVLQKSVQRAASLARQVSVLEQEKTALGTRLGESEKRVAQLAEAQQKAQTENARLTSLLARQGKELAANEAKNVQLYKHAVELLDRYEKKGMWASLAQAEPLTGLKRVEMENLLEEYRDKLDTQKVESAPRVLSGQ
jgi:chromosome segregation ATPase